MNTISKLIKITGSIGLSCVCLTAEADPKTMTLEEVKAFLEKQKEETSKRFQCIEREIKEINAIGASDGRCSRRVDEICKENKKGGVLNVTYNLDGTPCEIVTLGDIGETLFRQFDPMAFVRFDYMKEHFFFFSSDQDGFSKELTIETLKERGLTETEFGLLLSASVREVTFDSILSSDLFDETLRGKGRQWRSDKEKLEEAIDAYVKEVVILEYHPVRHVYHPEHGFAWYYDEKTQKNTMKLQKFSAVKAGSVSYFICGISESEALEEKRNRLKKALKSMLEYKNGREKVILLLLLDEMKPSEYRLEWVDRGDWNQGMYQHTVNRIMLDLKSDKIFKYLSHEIGHYLQFHLGVYPTFGDYRDDFAKKLLLLNCECEENDGRTFSLPQPLRNLFKKFHFNESANVPGVLMKKDLFAYWQLTSRWGSSAEISNILGICFNPERKTIYVHALSDIREQYPIRYGHASFGCAYDNYVSKGHGFEKTDDLNAFKKIVSKAAENKPNTDILKLLCKLHNTPFYEVINMFDAKTDEEMVKMESCCKFLPADK